MVGNNVAGKVAVITGAASGIGLALARKAAEVGMKVALSDVSEERLRSALQEIRELGAEAIAIRTDVSKLGDVEALRDETSRMLGEPWLVANNAGITKIALAWDHDAAAWKRMFDINIFGVVNGLLAFLPGLRERRSGHILNTASAAGLLTIPAAAAYVASKHAVVGLSETLYRELVASRSGVGCSLLCPALVKTNIMSSGEAAGASSAMQSAHALAPSEVARQVFEAIRERRFWVLTHAAQMEPHIRARTEQMVKQQNPDGESIDPDVARSSTLATGVDFSTAPE